MGLDSVATWNVFMDKGLWASDMTGERDESAAGPRRPRRLGRFGTLS